MSTLSKDTKDKSKFQKKLITAVVMIVVVGIIILLPSPEGLTPEGKRSLAVMVMAAFLWLGELLPIGASSLLILGTLPLLNIIPSKMSFSNFGSDTVFMYIGGFTIAACMSIHGLDKRIALAVINKTGTNKRMILLGLMLGCGLVSAWMSTVVVIFALLPVCLGMIKVMKAEPGSSDAKMFLFGLLFSGLTGGLATPVGTAPNALVMGFLREQAGIDMSFVDWMVYGTPLAIVLTFVCWICLVKYYKLDKSVDKELADYVKNEYKSMGKLQGMEMRTLWGLLIFAVLLFTVSPVKNIIGATFWSDGTAAIFSAVIVFLMGVITWPQANKGINWGLLLLFTAGLSISAGLRETGAAEWLANLISNAVPIWLLPVAFTVFGAVFTQMTSNTATAAILGPIAITTAQAAGISPELVAIPVILGVSLGFLTPVGSAPSPIVFGELPDGHTYIGKASDYVKAGIVPFILCLAITIIYVVYIVPLLGFSLV